MSDSFPFKDLFTRFCYTLKVFFFKRKYRCCYEASSCMCRSKFLFFISTLFSGVLSFYIFTSVSKLKFLFFSFKYSFDQASFFFCIQNWIYLRHELPRRNISRNELSSCKIQCNSQYIKDQEVCPLKTTFCNPKDIELKVKHFFL